MKGEAGPPESIAPGLYEGVPSEVYHAGPGVSKSQLDLLHKAPALLEWSRNAPRDDEARSAVDIGQAVHAVLLEPDSFPDLFVVEFSTPAGAIVTADDARAALDERGIGYTSKDTKQTLIGRLLEMDPDAPVLDALKEQWALGAKGKIVLTASEHRKVMLMRDSVWAHPFARRLIEAPGHVESSIYWRDPETGELCRCRPDKIADLGPVRPTVDVKSTDDVDEFWRSVEAYRYDVQDAFYTEGVHQHFGEAGPFIFLAVGTRREAGRYPVRCFVLPEEMRAAGRATMRADLDYYHDCRRKDSWPGVEKLKLPPWRQTRSAA